MARFDVYRFPNKATPFVVDVQANLLNHLVSRVIVPLTPNNAASREPMRQLNPIIRLLGSEYLLAPTDIGVVSVSLLRNPVANLEAEYRNDISAALDFLFQGF